MWGSNKNGAPGEIRTPDPLVRSQMLYPAELRARAAILPKFAGGAADVGYPIAAHGTRLGCRVERCGSAGWRRRNSRERRKIWWAWVDLNYRPHPYQGCALAT